jgi:septum site-determining protein MinD
VPQDDAVLQASNVGMPVVLDERSPASQAYKDAVRRLAGEQVELRFVAQPKRGFMHWLRRRSA